ncbi:MAG: MBL fold metallo-hydrolase [Acidimicrobiales bacterium]
MSDVTGLTLTVLGCSGTYPGAGGACSGYLVCSPGASLVVDLGGGTLANLQRHQAIGDIDALVLSHVHPDRWLDLPVLRNAMRYVLGIEGLPVYGTAETWLMAEVIVGQLQPTLLWHNVDESSVVEVGDQVVRFSRTDHPVETLAVRVDAGGRSLLYSADTGSGWDPGATGAGVDLMICEASLEPEHEGEVQHLSARQAGKLARTLGAGRLVVTHVVPGIDPDMQRDVAEQAFGGPVELAEANRSFEV